MARRGKRIAGKPARWMAEVHSPAICKAGRQNGESFQSRPARAECGLNVAARGAAGKPGILRILAGWCPQFESFSLLVSSSVVYSGNLTRYTTHSEILPGICCGAGRFGHVRRQASMASFGIMQQPAPQCAEPEPEPGFPAPLAAFFRMAFRPIAWLAHRHAHVMAK